LLGQTVVRVSVAQREDRVDAPEDELGQLILHVAAVACGEFRPGHLAVAVVRAARDPAEPIQDGVSYLDPVRGIDRSLELGAQVGGEILPISASRDPVTVDVYDVEALP
jgi:hypothetical protein